MIQTGSESPEPELMAHLERFRSPLTALIASWGTPWSDAAELAQDSFAEAYVKRDACRGDWRDHEFFGRWLRGVARNKHRAWARRRRRDPLTVACSLETHDVCDPHDQTDQAEQQERDDRIRRAIAALPERHRTVILMRYYDNTSLLDMARLIGTSPRAVEGRLYQARARLRKELDGEDVSTQQIRGVLVCL